MAAELKLSLELVTIFRVSKLDSWCNIEIVHHLKYKQIIICILQNVVLHFRHKYVMASLYPCPKVKHAEVDYR